MELVNPISFVIDTVVTCGGILLIYAVIRSASKKKS
ncbi:hypothetical protein JOC27_002571 [Sporolactobacillus spathodeae]|uniref:Holin-like toxin n=1 Tax=Sporolactobacillus spathodeae TaxID=1465502 RepID=A0ABS2QBE5_9BACL|nr:hypothetical protein [Sporolactobacillus spathodeae]